MRQISLNARAAQDAATTDEIEVVLLSFEHSSLASPLRLSTDPGARIAPADLAAGPWAEWWGEEPALIYGTRSTWRGADPVTDPYLFLPAAIILPDEIEEGPTPARIAIDNVHDGIGDILRSITDRATVHLAVVLASSPDLPEIELLDLQLLSASGDGPQFTLEISRLPIEQETIPRDRFTKRSFPGMWR